MKKYVFLVFLTLIAAPALALNLSAVGDTESSAVTAEEQSSPESQATVQAIAAVSTQAPTVKATGDDPRLKDLYHLLREIKKNNGVLDEPLIMTAETYISFNRNVLEKLGDNIIIAPDNFIIDGVPSQRVVIDWAILKMKLREAELSKDAETMHWMFKTFRVNPISGKDVFSSFYTLPNDDKFFDQFGLNTYNKHAKGNAVYSEIVLLQKLGATLAPNDPWLIAKSGYSASEAARKAEIEEEFVLVINDTSTTKRMFTQAKQVFPALQTLMD